MMDAPVVTLHKWRADTLTCSPGPGTIFCGSCDTRWPGGVHQPAVTASYILHIYLLSTIYRDICTKHGMSPECSCPSARYLLVVWSDCFTLCSVPGGKWSVKAKRVSALNTCGTVIPIFTPRAIFLIEIPCVPGRTVIGPGEASNY